MLPPIRTRERQTEASSSHQQHDAAANSYHVGKEVEELLVNPFCQQVANDGADGHGRY